MWLLVLDLVVDWTLVADEQGATEVDTPDLADGEDKYDDGLLRIPCLG